MCPECYSSYKRITPLRNPEECLAQHRQYMCSTCGRFICVSTEKHGKFRALFPFQSLEKAKLYLRSAEVLLKKPCGIYEFENTQGRSQFKIFSSETDVELYLKKKQE